MTMNKFLMTALTLAAVTLSGLVQAAPPNASSSSPDARVDPADRPVIGLQYDGPIRAVYQVSRDEWKDSVSKPLLYLKKLRGFYRKQGIESDQLDIRAVFHGGASTHLLTDEAWNRVKQTDTGNPNTQLLRELAEMGVKIELCNSRRIQEGWSKADIHPDVLLAAAAYARMIDLQHQGYAYIRF